MWNIACGFAQNTPELLVFRFLAGLGGSAPLSVRPSLFFFVLPLLISHSSRTQIGGGVLGDVWRTHERGRAIALYSLAPLLGPVIGPICGAWVDQDSTWRWVFWSTSIVNCVVQGMGFLFLRETFHPILLERKVGRMRKEMIARGGREAEDAKKLRTPFQGGDRQCVLFLFVSSGCSLTLLSPPSHFSLSIHPTRTRSWKHIFAKSIIRPFALFAREPIIQLLGAYMAFVYGILYLVLTTVPSIYQGAGSVYDEKVRVALLYSGME